MIRKHELSSSHKQAVEVTITLPATTGNIAGMLSQEVMKAIAHNRSMLLKIMSSLQFLADRVCIFEEMERKTVISCKC